MTGNAGTNPFTDFLGTTDGLPLFLKVGGALGPIPGLTLFPADQGSGEPDPNVVVFSDMNSIGLSVGSSILGGRNNSILDNAWWAVVLGGEANQIDSFAHYSSIAGGTANSIGFDAAASFIAGGQQNRVEQAQSFAGGYRAHAVHPGTFVWAGGGDPFNPAYPSSGDHTFNAFASGGVSFDFGAQSGDGRGASWLHLGDTTQNGRFLDTSTTAHLTSGGTWVNASDRNRKTNYAEVDSRAVLDKVVGLTIKTWNYKIESADDRHMGPVAQDFHAAFGLGSSDKHISTVDAEGVALVAIQGLNKKLEDELAAKEVEIELLKEKSAKLDELAARLTEIEKLLNARK